MRYLQLNIFLFVVCALLCVRASLLSQNGISNIKTKDSKDRVISPRKLLPQLPPHPDKSFIVEFVADGVEACNQMEPLVKRLEEELNIKVRRINIGKRQDFLALFDLVGGNEGGNLPFFYNRRTAQAICGPTPYTNLFRLGTSDRRHLFYDVPTAEQELNDNTRKGNGFMGYIEGAGKRFIKNKADAILNKVLDEKE